MATLNVKLDKLSMVDHPSHYSGSIEAIDAIAAATAGLTGVEAFDTGNALKYLWRWKRKNGVEDLNKAVWYIQHLIKHLEGTKTEAEAETEAEAIETQPSLKEYLTMTVNTDEDKIFTDIPITDQFYMNSADQLMKNLGADVQTAKVKHDLRKL